MSASYVGRFAPTPSGALHFGSLCAALASWLDARAVSGRWLLRMEDIDPPREVAGAQDGILRTLEAFGLCWDGEVLRQSTRLAAYREQLNEWQQQGLVYACTCPVYPGTCRAAAHGAQSAALRLRVPAQQFAFVDRVQGAFRQNLAEEVGDFVLWRKDGFPAYQLAVVLDDIAQGVTDIVRGADLLDSTPRQLYLYQLLRQTPPRYLHLPLLLQADGRKLGKSFRSEALGEGAPAKALVQALRVLGQTPPAALAGETVAAVLQWALVHWQSSSIPARQRLTESEWR